MGGKEEDILLMINLVSLDIKNFMSIESLHLDFPKVGNYLISGFNEIGGDSNGSGKSTIINSIIWCLFGRTAKGLKGVEVVRWGSTEPTGVCLGLKSESGYLYEIDRTDRSVKFSVDGVETVGHKGDIQQTINETFKTSFDLFLSSVSFTKGQVDFLTDSGDAAKKRLFKSLLRLEKIDKMYDKAKTLHASLTASAQKLEYELMTNETRIASLRKELERLDEQRRGWETIHAKAIQKLKDELAEQKPDIDFTLENRFREEEAALRNLEQHMEVDLGEVGPLMELLSKTYQDINYHKVCKETLEKEIEKSKSLQGKVCNYCGAQLSKRSMAKLIEEKEQTIVEITQTLNMMNMDMRSLEEKINHGEALQKEHNSLNMECQSLKALVDHQRHYIKSFDTMKKQLESRIQEEEKATNPYEPICTAKNNEIVTLNLQTTTTKDQFTNVTKNIDIYAYLKWVLSREGVVAVIIQKTFERLEVLINHYLSRICTEGFYVTISPQKELKSGEMKESIDIVITQDGQKIPYAALSGGQEQRVTIAALMALYRLSRELGMNRFNFLLLDEVVDLSLAEKGQQDIVRLLESMEAEIRNIFVISHKDNMAAEFPFQINVRRGMDKITRLEGIYAG
jgi:DNA repair exonuclease SbcCD ATPase subunit